MPFLTLAFEWYCAACVPRYCAKVSDTRAALTVRVLITLTAEVYALAAPCDAYIAHSAVILVITTSAICNRRLNAEAGCAVTT